MRLRPTPTNSDFHCGFAPLEDVPAPTDPLCLADQGPERLGVGGETCLEPLCRQSSAGPGRLRGALARRFRARGEEIFLAPTVTPLLVSLLRRMLLAEPGRSKIITDGLTAPRLQTVVQGLGPGPGLEWIPSGVGVEVGLDRLVDGQTALVGLNHISPPRRAPGDMARITRRVRRSGVLMLWDVGRCAGVVPLDVQAWGVDLAMGSVCGPFRGARGWGSFLYVRRELHDCLCPAQPPAEWL